MLRFVGAEYFYRSRKDLGVYDDVEGEESDI
jgi:hypothetical protein